MGSRVPGDRLAPLYDLAAEAGIERSTAWRWLKNGELGEPVKIPGDRPGGGRSRATAYSSGGRTWAGHR